MFEDGVDLTVLSKKCLTYCTEVWKNIEFQWNTDQLGYLIPTLSEGLGILCTLIVSDMPTDSLHLLFPLASYYIKYLENIKSESLLFCFIRGRRRKNICITKTCVHCTSHKKYTLISICMKWRVRKASRAPEIYVPVGISEKYENEMQFLGSVSLLLCLHWMGYGLLRKIWSALDTLWSHTSSAFLLVPIRHTDGFNCFWVGLTKAVT